MSDDKLRLHRIHAVPSTGNSLDLGATRWRPVDGGTHEEKRAQEYRMAFAWNMAEGIPTSALEAGCVRLFYAAVQDLLSAIRAGEALDRHVALVQSAHDAHRFDDTHGRLHDCPGCLPEEADEPGVPAAPQAEDLDDSADDHGDVQPVVAVHRGGRQGELF